MLFPQYQVSQQVWRLSVPTSTLLSGAWSGAFIESISGLVSPEFEARTVIDFYAQIVVDTPCIATVYGKNVSGEYTAFGTFSLVSGMNMIESRTVGIVSYDQIGLVNDAAIEMVVSSGYVGDSPYADRDNTFVDKVWKYVATIYARTEPVGTGYSAMQYMQSFPDITELGYADVSYAASISPEDVLVDVNGVTRQTLGQPELHTGMLPHMVLYLKRIQWELL